MLTEFDDLGVLQRIRQHDQGAFRSLYHEYGGAVYSLAYRVLQNSALAEEVTQDTFLKVWQQKTVWDPQKGKFKNWLLTVTHFTAIDRLRQERRQPTLHPEDLGELDELSPVPDGGAFWQDGGVLRLLVEQLPREVSALIELAFYQGLSHSEIADYTRLPLGTVKTRLRSGLQRLRELWLDANGNVL